MKIVLQMVRFSHIKNLYLQELLQLNQILTGKSQQEESTNDKVKFLVAPIKTSWVKYQMRSLNNLTQNDFQSMRVCLQKRPYLQWTLISYKHSKKQIYFWEQNMPTLSRQRPASFSATQLQSSSAFMTAQSSMITIIDLSKLSTMGYFKRCLRLSKRRFKRQMPALNPFLSPFSTNTISIITLGLLLISRIGWLGKLNLKSKT